MEPLSEARREELHGDLVALRRELRRGPDPEGDLGVCDGCGADVGLARLEPRPEAPFCLACQGQGGARGRG